ncbi:MAG: hypothetical protein J0L97_05350 [Alphaproteobacteria bacterium]|nr:hypothetical protein [Alphaproteobacteria bacterium]
MAHLFTRMLLYARRGVLSDPVLDTREISRALRPLQHILYNPACATLDKESYTRLLSQVYVNLLRLTDEQPGYAETVRFFLTHASTVAAKRFGEDYRLDLRKLSSPEHVMRMLEITLYAPMPAYSTALTERANQLFALALDPSLVLDTPALPDPRPPLPPVFDYEAIRKAYGPPEFMPLPGRQVTLTDGDGQKHRFILHTQQAEEYVVMMNGQLYPKAELARQLAEHHGHMADFTVAADDAALTMQASLVDPQRVYEPLTQLDGMDLTQRVAPVSLEIDYLTGLTFEESKKLSEFVRYVSEILHDDPELLRIMTPYIARKFPPLGTLSQQGPLASDFDLVALYRYLSDPSRPDHRQYLNSLAIAYEADLQGGGGGAASTLELLGRASERLYYTATVVEEAVKEEFKGKSRAHGKDGAPVAPEYVVTVGGSGVGKNEVQEEAKRRCSTKGGLVVASLDAQRESTDMFKLLQRVGFHSDDYKIVESLANACRQGIMIAARGYNLLRDCSGTPYKRELDLIVQAIEGGREVHVEMVFAPMYKPDKQHFLEDAAGRTLNRLYRYDEESGLFVLREDGRGLISSVLYKKHAEASREGLDYRGKIINDLEWICAEQGVPFDPTKVHFRAINNSGGMDEAYIAEQWVVLSPQQMREMGDVKLRAHHQGDPMLVKQHILEHPEVFLPTVFSDEALYSRPENIMSAVLVRQMPDGSGIVRVTLDAEAMLDYELKATINPNAKDLSQVDSNDRPYCVPGLDIAETISEDPEAFPHVTRILQEELGLNFPTPPRLTA